MTLSTVGKFMEGWNPAYLSSRNKTHVDEIHQGGNYLLAATAQGAQAAWTSSLLSSVAKVSQGPLKNGSWLASCLMTPLISTPVCLIAAAVKEGFYESSLEVPLEEQTKYFTLGEEREEPIQGTISLLVNGGRRHYLIGRDITSTVENSTEVIEDGKKKFYYYHTVQAYENFSGDFKFKEILINGVPTKVQLSWETTNEVEARLEIISGGKRRYFVRGREVEEPILGTVAITETTTQDSFPAEKKKYYLLGKEVPPGTQNSVAIKVPKQPIHYELGKELASPTAKTRTFVIDGKQRHFLSVKNVPNHTQGLAELVNKIPRLPLKLPLFLGMRTVKVLTFISEKAGDVVWLIALAAGAILVALGHYYVAGGILTAVVYQYIDHSLGLVPRKMSLFIERWMPTVSMVGLLLIGSWGAQLLAAATLLTYIPSANKYIQGKIDRTVRGYCIEPLIKTVADIIDKKQRAGGRSPMSVEQRRELDELLHETPLMEECDAPLIQKKNLSFSEINNILDGNKKNYEFNPAHLTKAVAPLNPLTEDRRFEKLMMLWDKIGNKWTEDKYVERLLKRLVDDKRFILFLQHRFPEARRFIFKKDPDKSFEESTRLCDLKREAHRDQFEDYIATLAKEKGQTKNQFIAAWTREQLKRFVDTLNGKQRVEGPQALLEEAIQNTAKILPFLTKANASPIEIEDALVKLAIEGGGYCSLALRRVSGEILEGAIEGQLTEQAETPADPETAFEHKAFHELQRARLQIIQYFIHGVVEGMKQKEALQDTAEDVHLYELVTKVMKRGFYHLSNHQMEEFGITELINFETFFLPARVGLGRMYKERLDKIMGDIGRDPKNLRNNKVLEYLRSWVNKNPALSASEKKLLLDGALADSEDNLIDSDFYEKINRLFLIMLGVFRERKVQPQPALPNVRSA